MAHQMNMENVRLRRRQLAREAEERESGAHFDKLKEGGNMRRILPPWSEAGNWSKRAAYHYKLAPRGFVCPKKTFDKPCPACEYVDLLYKEKTTESLAQAKEYRAKERFFANVLNLDFNDGKVYVMAFGPQLEESILDSMDGGNKSGSAAGDQFGVGDITNPKTGRNMLITKDVPPGHKEQTSYKAQPSQTQSEVANWAAVEKQLFDLDAIVQKDVVSAEDIMKILNGESVAAQSAASKPAASAGSGQGTSGAVTSEFEKPAAPTKDEFGRPVTNAAPANPAGSAPPVTTPPTTTAPATPTGGSSALAKLRAMKAGATT